MNKYLFLEIGKSAYTEFKMKNRDFEETQDAILVDEIEATSEKEAYKKLLNSKQHKNKIFDKIIIRELKP
jgi:hypothetical protein